MVEETTIAAIATPLGEGGLSVIRISGPQALEIADSCFRPASRRGLRPSQVPSHTLHFGHIVQGERVIDEVMLAVMRAPRTFTRENVVEISSHGGMLPARLVLETILKHGARLAEPGEFTRRAFLNGRIDLAQAEAVADFIAAKTDLALRAANDQLAGKLSSKINSLRDGLMEALAHIEAHIDFPDERIDPDNQAALEHRFEEGIALVENLIRTAPEGQILRRGVKAAIIGRPNAGKSSLLNQMLGHDRAIVSPLPGTTRDTIEETANIRGLPVVFVDTAGLREAGDSLEAEGIRRSRRSIEAAELILHVLDASEDLNPFDLKLLEETRERKRLLILNKWDLPVRLTLPGDFEGVQKVQVSCVTGQGAESLKDAIKNMIWSGEIQADNLALMINARHEEVLRRAHQALERTLASLRAQDSYDLVAFDLRVAVNAIGEVVGKTATEDLLDVIFSRFCIGK